MKEEFTKGEWSTHIRGVKGKDFHEVVVTVPDGGFEITNIPDATANAHLIAASPEMYRLLSDLSAFNCPMEYTTPDEYIAFSKIEKVLAKARGES